MGKTQIQDTSRESLKELRNGKIDGRRLQIYNAIKQMGQCSNSMIAQHTGLKINQVTGRVNELRDDPFKCVGFSHKELCPITERFVCFWKVVKDFDTIEQHESKIFNNVVGKCYKCGCVSCGCEVQI